MQKMKPQRLPMEEEIGENVHSQENEIGENHSLVI